MNRTLDQIKQAELERLAFMQGRDGPVLAKAFAEQTYSIYRNARKNPTTGKPTPYGKAYRTELIGSCVVLRQFLRGQ